MCISHEIISDWEEHSVCVCAGVRACVFLSFFFSSLSKGQYKVQFQLTW